MEEVTYSEPLNFPACNVEGGDLFELRRYVKDLSRFAFERSLNPAKIISNGDFNYQVEPTDHVLLLDPTTAGAKGLTMPSIEDADAVKYTFKRINNSGVGPIVFATPDSALIEGLATVSLAALSVQPSPYFSATLVSDGTDWWAI